MNRNFLTPLDRRELLKRGLVVASIGAVPSLLAACGGDDDGGDAAAPTATQADGTPTVPPASGTVDYLSWEGYDIPGRDASVAGRARRRVQVDVHREPRRHPGEDRRRRWLLRPDHLLPGLQAALSRSSGSSRRSTSRRSRTSTNEFPYFKSDVGNFWIDADGTWTGVPWTLGSIGITWDDEALPGGLNVLVRPPRSEVREQDRPSRRPGGLLHARSAHPRVRPGEGDAGPEDRDRRPADADREAGEERCALLRGHDHPARERRHRRLLAGLGGDEQLRRGRRQDDRQDDRPEGGQLLVLRPLRDPDDGGQRRHRLQLPQQCPRARGERRRGGVPRRRESPSRARSSSSTRAIRSLYPYEDLDGLLERAPFYNNPPVESDEFVTYEEWVETWQEVKAST